MQEPEKPDDPQPFKGLALDKFGDATQKLFRDLTRKHKSSLEHAKEALKGNEEAKDELANRAANAWMALGRLKKTAGEVTDKAKKKISDARKNDKPPSP